MKTPKMSLHEAGETLKEGKTYVCSKGCDKGNGDFEDRLEAGTGVLITKILDTVAYATILGDSDTNHEKICLSIGALERCLVTRKMFNKILKADKS